MDSILVNGSSMINLLNVFHIYYRHEPNKKEDEPTHYVYIQSNGGARTYFAYFDRVEAETFFRDIYNQWAKVTEITTN
jgi:hypothetical protein